MWSHKNEDLRANENRMSCCERERALWRVKGWNSWKTWAYGGSQSAPSHGRMGSLNPMEPKWDTYKQYQTTISCQAKDPKPVECSNQFAEPDDTRLVQMSKMAAENIFG